MLYLTHQKQEFSQPTRRALRAADGYLFLGLAGEALREIDSTPEDERNLPDVMLARIRVLLHLRKWKQAEASASLGQKEHPDRDEFMVQRAFALHKMRKGGKAMDVILSAPDWIRRTGILHYNLACYEAQLGDKRTARQCISVAIQMNEAMRSNAKSDPDLQGLWN